MGVSETNRERRWREPAAVYRLWDAEGNLLYIGSAYDPEQRCREHQKKPWWPLVARRTDEWFSNRGRAYSEESKALSTEPSSFNEMGVPGYQVPQTEAIRQRKALASLRQQLISESGSIEHQTAKAEKQRGATGADATKAGSLAAIEFLEATGLFPNAVRRRRARLEQYGF